MTYDDALAVWYARTNFEVRAAAPADLKLERMRRLLRLLGGPHLRTRTVHVTGTKGKGSTSAFLASVLRAAGYRVGLFTSPHLTDVRERIQVDGVPISREELTARMGEVAAAAKLMDADGGPASVQGPGPTFFEIGTALGFLHFLYRRCDVAVVEVGLGGRFDSTNVCRPLVSVVTNVGLDHTAQLGPTLDAIAYQKAGIVKPRVPVVSGVTQPGPRAVVEREAKAANSPLHQLGKDFRPFSRAGGYDPATGRWVPTRLGFYRSRHPWPEMDVGLLGDHQATNAALAVAAVEVLRDAGMPVPDAAVAKGLANVTWPARVEVVGVRPFVVLDTAHNVPSAEALVHTLAHALPAAGRKRLVFAVSADKPYRDMLRVLAGYFDDVHVCPYAANPRTVPPETLLAVLAKLAPGVTATAHPSAAAAWAAARGAAGPADVVCVTGSVFLAGELRDVVRG